MTTISPTENLSVISAYFSRSIARTKALKSGQTHVAFVDGTMAVYSQEEINQMEYTIMSHTHETRIKEINAYIDSKLDRYYVPF